MHLRVNPEVIEVPHDIDLVWRAINHPDADEPVDTAISVAHRKLDSDSHTLQLGLNSETEYNFELVDVPRLLGRHAIQAWINPLVLEVKKFNPPKEVSGVTLASREDRAIGTVLVDKRSFVSRSLEKVGDHATTITVSADVELHLGGGRKELRLKRLAERFGFDPEEEFVRQINHSLEIISEISDELAATEAGLASA